MLARSETVRCKSNLQVCISQSSIGWMLLVLVCLASSRNQSSNSAEAVGKLSSMLRNCIKIFNFKKQEFGPVCVKDLGKSFDDISEFLNDSIPSGNNELELSMVKIKDWFDAEGKERPSLQALFKWSKVGRRADRHSILEAAKFLTLLDSVIYPGNACTDDSYRLLDCYERASNWHHHRNFLAANQRLIRVDELIKHYSFRHADQCISVNAEKFSQVKLGTELMKTLEEMLMQIYSSQHDSIEIYYSESPGDKLVEFIENAAQISWPQFEHPIDKGQIYAKFLSGLNPATAASSDLARFNWEHLFKERMLEPCKEYTKAMDAKLMSHLEQDLSIFRRFKDFFSWILEEHASSPNRAAQLQLLKAYVIYKNCQSMIINQASVFRSLIGSTESY